MNNKKVGHPSGGLTDDKYMNIKDHETQNKRTNQNNRCYTLFDNELQSSPQLEDPNKTYDWKTTNNYEDELVMAYNNNSKSSTLYPRTLYVLYIGP